MKKIVFITNAMLIGGAEKVIATLANSFNKNGIKVTIFTIMNTECEFQLNEGVKIKSVYEKEGKPLRREYKHYYNKLREMVKNENPDIIVVMPEEISVKAIPFLKDLNIPLVVSERNNPRIMPKNKLNRILRKIYYPKVDGIIFQTESAKEYFSKKIQEKSIVLLNPLDSSRMPKEYNGVRNKTIVTVGRLEEQKNQKMLINAFAQIQKKHKDYRLIIYGNGSLKEELETYAKEKLPRRKYAFEPASNDVLDKINGAGIFVLSSNYEGMPNALIEAMAIGVPCVSTDCPSYGPRELIDNYKNGILINVNDEEELVLAINEIILNKSLGDKLSKNGKKIKFKLDEEKIVSQWKKYFDDVIKQYKQRK